MTFGDAVVGIIGFACLIYMFRGDGGSKRQRIYERLEVLEEWKIKIETKEEYDSKSNKGE